MHGHLVRADLLEPDPLEVNRDVGVEVDRSLDLVDELSGDSVGRDRPAVVAVLGDHARPVGRDLGDRHPRFQDVGDLLEPREVAAHGVGCALDDVAGDDGAGEPIPICGRPGVPPRRRPDGQ